MKIAIVSLWFYDHSIQMANSLSKDHEVLLLISADVQKEYLINIDCRVNVKYFDVHYLKENLKYLYNINAITGIHRAIKAYEPDVIHVQVSNPLLIPLYMLWSPKYPIVSTFHDVKIHAGEKNRSHEVLMHFAKKYSDRIIVHGKLLKQEMLEMDGSLKDKVVTVPIGEHEVAPFKIYENEGIKEENIVLFFGRIFQYKGLEYLIKAEPVITSRFPGTKIMIAGTGEKFDKYYDIMENKENYIVLNRYIPYSEGAEIYEKSSVVVLPYIEASQSGVIPTAYSFKKPVVVTNVGSIPEIVDNGITGYIVPPKDPRSLADAIIRLLENRDLRIRMGNNGYNKLKTDLSWEKISKLLLNVYSDAAKNKSAA